MKFTNSYIDLGEEFFQRVLPQKVPAPKLLLWNGELASSLFFTSEQQEDHEQLSQYFSGNELPDDSISIALAYSGHQFGHFNPQLGDGRAHLLGEMVDESEIRRDIQLKGSGQTAFSRRGDGKCALAPALREYIMSEALYALGVPTSRCLAVVSTGEVINRGLAKAGAVVTRVASSHIRVGSFQYFAARGNNEALKKLFDYSIERHFPEISAVEYVEGDKQDRHILENRILLFLEKVLDKQIRLVVEWLRIGFIHGVMNTDNTAICGETIDFGPCAMMGGYNEKAVFSSIDEYGRYAFGNQGKIAQWNMARLADCLLPLLIECSDLDGSEEDKAEHALEKVESVIHQYTGKFDKAYFAMYRKKLGMTNSNNESKVLVSDLLTIMQTHRLDYTQTFNLLTQSLTDISQKEAIPPILSDWYDVWNDMLSKNNISRQKAKALMTKSNPVVIPRNHHVEALLAQCEQVVMHNQASSDKENGVAGLVDEFLQVVCSPYQEIKNTNLYQDTPQDNDKYYQTFCGT